MKQITISLQDRKCLTLSGETQQSMKASMMLENKTPPFKRKTNPQNLMCGSLCWRASLGPSLTSWKRTATDSQHWNGLLAHGNHHTGQRGEASVPPGYQPSCLRVTVYGGLQAPDPVGSGWGSTLVMSTILSCFLTLVSPEQALPDVTSQPSLLEARLWLTKLRLFCPP